MKDDYLIVDIGSKATDVVYVQNGFPSGEQVLYDRKGDDQVDERDPPGYEGADGEGHTEA